MKTPKKPKKAPLVKALNMLLMGVAAGIKKRAEYENSLCGGDACDGGGIYF